MKKRAIVLEGGSLRCMFTAGVIDSLMREGFSADGLFGVSAGALSGVNFVSRQIGRTAEINLNYVNDKRYMGIRNLILHGSIFNFDFMFGELNNTLVPLDSKTLMSSPCEFTAVATSCISGKPVYFEKSTCGDIYAAIRASASLPLLAPIVMVDGIPCLDGGVSVSIPYQRAIDEGYEKILVVTTREHGYRKQLVSPTMAKTYARMYRKYPALVRSLIDIPRRYARELDEIDRLEADGRIFVIRPPRPVNIARTEKDTAKLKALYNEGTAAFENSLAAFKEYWGD